jgi:hypothetical protein
LKVIDQPLRIEYLVYVYFNSELRPAFKQPIDKPCNENRERGRSDQRQRSKKYVLAGYLQVAPLIPDPYAGFNNRRTIENELWESRRYITVAVGSLLGRSWVYAQPSGGRIVDIEEECKKHLQPHLAEGYALNPPGYERLRDWTFLLFQIN